MFSKPKSRAPWLMMGITTTVLAIAIIAVTYLLLGNRGVAVDLYGAAADPTMIQLEHTLSLLKNKFPDSLRAVNLHLVADLKDNKLSSYLLAGVDQPTEEQTAVGNLDLEEAGRQLWTREQSEKTLWRYLAVRNTDLLAGSWVLAATYADLDPAKIQAAQESGDFEKLLRQESEDLQKIRASLDPRLNLLPFLFFNGELYRGRADLMSLSAHTAKLILRGGRESLPEKRPLSLFGGRLALAPFRHYLINGIPEAYSDADCQDKPKKIGRLENANTAFARCVYTDPPVVHLKVYTELKDYNPSQDSLVFNLEQDLKGLATIPAMLDDATKEDLTKKIQDLKLDDKISALTNAPYYVFEPDLQKDPLFSLYQQAGLVFSLPDGRFLLNRLAI